MLVDAYVAKTNLLGSARILTHAREAWAWRLRKLVEVERILVTVRNRSKIPETPPTCLQMDFYLFGGRSSGFRLDSQGPEIGRFRYVIIDRGRLSRTCCLRRYWRENGVKGPQKQGAALTTSENNSLRCESEALATSRFTGSRAQAVPRHATLCFLSLPTF